jgi:hypothetical protein
LPQSRRLLLLEQVWLAPTALLGPRHFFSAQTVVLGK